MPDVNVNLLPTRIIELALEIVLEAMKGQTPEQKAKMWEWHIQDVERFRAFALKLFKLDTP